METTEKIVESYCRYVKGWPTIANIKCGGQLEIDLLAVDVSSTADILRYHIECGVSISGTFSKLTGNAFSEERLKQRSEAAPQRRTVGYFAKRKFGSKEILTELERYGFKRNNYKKVIVTWGWEPEAQIQAIRERITLWDFRDILKDLLESFRHKSSYFTDDTLRTIQLLIKSGSIKYVT